MKDGYYPMNLNKLARDTYIKIFNAKGYEDQEPAYKAAKWYHLLWFLVPIVGFILFVIHVEETYKENNC
jgi:hypothetical protein